MKPKTIALLVTLAIVSANIDAGDSKIAVALKNQTELITDNLKEKAKAEINKAVIAIQNTIKFIESDRNHENLKNGLVQGNYEAIGLSGEIGAYQIMPTTWKYWSKKFFDEILEPNQANQDLLVYKVIEDLINRGYSTEEIAATWNSGSPDNWQTKVGVNSFGAYYNVPAYVAAFKDIHDNLKQIIA
jgi:hypothetical protein